MSYILHFLVRGGVGGGLHLLEAVVLLACQDLVHSGLVTAN